MSDREKFKEYMNQQYYFGGMDGNMVDDDDVDCHYNEYRSLEENKAELDQFLEQVEEDEAEELYW